MTTPTLESFVTVVTGLVFSGRGTITRSILSAGGLATKPFSSYHRLFSAARWSLDAVGLRVFDLVEPWLGDVIMLGADDTLARKRGLKIFGVGMHHDRLPSPAAMLESRCRRVTLGIYGRSQKARVADCIAWVHAAPHRPLRIMATEAIGGGRGVEASYSTYADATAERVIGHYASRWSIEVAYRGVKQSLGFEQPQGWCRKTAERTAPMAMLIYSLVIIWFAREGHRRWKPADYVWYATKRHSSCADMLAELKRRNIRGCILSLLPDTLGPRKLFRILENAVNLAA